MTRRWHHALVTLVVLAVAATLFTGAADGGTPAPARRVLVFSVPTLQWADLEEFDAPNLEDLLERSAIADLSPRAVNRRTSSTEGYASLNAGTRAAGTAAATLAFERGEYYEGASAAAEFTRRTGVSPPEGSVFTFGIVSLESANDRLLFGAEVGSLGNALAEAEIPAAVVANGDHPEGPDDLDYQREAAIGLIDDRGIVPGGRVADGLLEVDPVAPYATRLDIDAVSDAFTESWNTADRSVVLVEASDLVRWDDFRSLATPDQQDKLLGDTLAQTDELLGHLLEEVDLERDAVVVVGPYPKGSGSHLTIFGVAGPNIEPGLLSSGTTRRPGFVSIVDVAPTVLDLLDVEQPDSMEGAPSARDGSGGSADDRRAFLIEANDAALFRDAMVGPASRNFVLAQIVLWVLALIVMRWGPVRHTRTVAVAALCILAFLPATFLAALLPFYRWGGLAFWAFTVSVALAIGLGADLIGRRRLLDPLILVLSSILALLFVDVLTGANLQLNTVFGYTPTVAGRFAGFGNPAFAMLAASSIMLAALVAHRVGGRRGAWAGVAILAVSVVMDGAPMWGADVGGVLSLVPAAGVTAWLLLGLQIRIRTAVAWTVAAITAVTLFGLVDLTRPAAERSHLGRLFEDIGSNGFEAFETVVLRKLGANLAVLTTSVWTLMLPVVFAFVGYLFWRAPWRLRRIQEEIPEERAALAGLITGGVLGFALNDSGIAVPGMMLGVVNASLVYLILRIAPGPPAVSNVAPSDDRVTSERP